MRKDRLPLPSFFRGKLAVKDSGGVNLSVRKNRNSGKNFRIFVVRLRRKKTPSPTTEEVQPLDSSGLSFVLMGTSWISALRRRHRAFHSFQQWFQPFFRRVSFGAKVSRFRFVFGRVRTCWWSKKIGAGITRLGALGVQSPMLLLMVQKSSTSVEVGS